MHTFIRVAAAVALLLVVGVPAIAADPFQDARWYMGARQDARAIAVIDSGQFDINMQNDEGYTLLHFAAGDGNLAMVEALLARGADPTIRTGLGRTPQDQAIGTMVSARLRRAEAEWKAGARGGAAPAAGGADFDKVRWNIGARRNADAIAELDKGIDINMQTSEGYTLLHYAAGDGNLEMVRELLRRGANPNLRAQSGFTPLDSAIGTMVQAEIRKAGGRNGAPAASRPSTASTPAAKPSKPGSAKPAKPASSSAATPAADSPRRKMCNQRHHSSSALCSDSTCKMREYRKWQTCLKTGSYY